MSFPRYESYKDSGVEWLGEVPEHWELMRLKRNLRLLTEKTDRRENPVALENIESWSGSFIQTETKFEGEGIAFESGDILFGKLRPYLAKVYLADTTGEAVGDFHVMRPTKDIDSRFSQYQILNREFIAIVDGSTFGAKMPRVSWDFLSNMVLTTPPIPEQQTIAAFLDRETAKIDALIAEQQRLIELLKEKITSLVLSSINSTETKELRLENAARIISRPVIQKENELYTPIGLFNRGRGLFHKEPREMNDMGDSDFFWVEEGDLIISGQFAWEGAVALAGKEDTGCVVSHRYPVLHGQPGICLTEYLFALLLTKHGDFLLNENSRGAAGRNRPLNVNSLMKEKIPVPDMQIQEQVAQAVYWRNILSVEISKQIDLLQERRTALISAAVTGKIDVRGLVSAKSEVEQSA
jgi:type I restriction enzyme, S subunit